MVFHNDQPCILFILPVGFLNIFVYEAEGSSTVLGQVDVSQTKPVWNYQTICPPRSVKPRADRFMSVVGSGGVSFAVDLSQNPSEITLDVPQPVDVKNTKSIVVTFNPPKDISDRQLDITVTSQSNTPAYLKVSQIRQDVESIEVVDYKKASLRLSFAKKGRITLSKVSEPPLTDSTSTWYIGIALNNSTGRLSGPSESKYVTLKLSQSFDYNYARPICSLFFVSLVGGILLSVAGLCCFKEYLVEVNNTVNRNVVNPSSNGNNCLSRIITELFVFITKCFVFISAMLKVAYKYWFSGGPKTYSYATGFAGFVLMIGACQFVIENWYVMIQEGDRDNCYYNDLCYRVSDYHDMPLNLMISNLTYIVHALILAVSVWYMETELYLFCENLKKSVTSGEQATQPDGQENGNNNDNLQSTSSGCRGKQQLPNHVLVCPNITLHLHEGAVPEHTLGNKEKQTLMARALKRKYSYSIGYAFAWALLFEGLFSLLYHLCPSRYTFQFDSAFMFVMAGLTVMLLYNGMELSDCPVDKHQEGHHPVEEPVEELPVGALNFFLYFIVPLFIFNYIGTLYHSKSGLAIGLQVVFFISLIIWWTAMSGWAFYKLKCLKGGSSLEKCDMCCYIVGCVIVPPALFVPVFLFMDLSLAFLVTCIVESLWAVSAKAELLQKLGQLCEALYERKCPGKCEWKDFFRGLYIFSTVACLVGAFVVFDVLATTNKAASPEDSRDKNEECGILGFFDWHDLWHFLSSFALLMSAFVVMFISAKKEKPSNDEPKNRNVARRNGGEMGEVATHDPTEDERVYENVGMAAKT